MNKFHKSSSIICKVCVVLFSVLLASTCIVGCVDEKARSEKTKAEILAKMSELTALQDKSVAMMAGGDTEGAKKFAETTVAEKHTEISNLVEDKAKEQLIMPADQTAVLKILADNDSEYRKKLAAAPTVPTVPTAPTAPKK